MKQYAPRFQVMLYQVSSGGRDYDVTNWLGEGCVIHTSKGIREAAGSFTISLADKIHPAKLDSIYSMAAPMDAIEIRAAHDGSSELKLLMRGYISSVRRDETMGQDGKPVRRITITGQDVGKLMLIHMIHFLPNAAEQHYVLTGYGNLVKYFGDAARPYSANEFVAKFADILNIHNQTILGHTRIKELVISPDAAIEGVIPVSQLNPLTEMSYYQFMSYMLDIGPFNELFTQDHDQGAYLIARPNFEAPDGITFSENEVQQVSVSRSDAQVANWFWVLPRGGSLIDQISAKIEADRLGGVPDARMVEECKESIYGWRKMQVDVNLRPAEYGNQDAPQKDSHVENRNATYDWLLERTQKLKDNNYKNAHLEAAVFRLEGNESVKPGTWVTFNKGDTMQRYYVTRVEHEIQFFGGFFTTLHGEGGNGYEIRKAGNYYRPELNLKGALK